MAERLNGILKQEYGLGSTFRTKRQAVKSVTQTNSKKLANGSSNSKPLWPTRILTNVWSTPSWRLPASGWMLDWMTLKKRTN